MDRVGSDYAEYLNARCQSILACRRKECSQIPKEALHHFKNPVTFKYQKYLKHLEVSDSICFAIVLPPLKKSSLNTKLARFFLVIKFFFLIIEKKNLEL